MKYLAFFVALLFLITGVLTLVLGINKIVEGVLQFVEHENGRPGTYLIEAVDTLLFALVILILSGGIYKLFVGDSNTFKNNSVLSKLNSFKDLKVLLWETILLTLTVLAALEFFLTDDHSYEHLILPGSVLLLALGLRVMKGGKSTSKLDKHD